MCFLFLKKKTVLMSFTHGNRVVCKASLVSDLLLLRHAVNKGWRIRSNPTKVKMDRLTLIIIIIIIIIIMRQ